MATDIIARGLAVSNSGGGGGSTSVDIQDGVGIEFTGSDPIIINNGGITNVQTGNDSDDNGTIRVTYGKDSKTKSVPVKGLDNAAYKSVDTVIDESTKDSENLPTTKAVKKILDSKIDSGKLGEANGIATLDEYKKLVSDQLPSHNHGSNEVNVMTNYQKPSNLTEKEIKETDSLNTAIGKLEKNLDDKMDDGNYAGSSTKGGSATSAEKLSNTEQIGTNKKPVYFSADGVPVAIDHTINSDVPENAKFTDTKYSAGTGIRVTDDTIYNMGVLSMSESTTNGCIDITVGKNGTETSESKTIPVHGLGDAAYKSVGTVVTKDSADLITSGAVSAELDKKMNSSMRNSADGVAGLDGNSKINVSQIPTTDEYNVESAYPVTSKAVEAAMNTLPNPMLYKGSLGEGGTITALPTASAGNEGFTYKVITPGTYAGQSAKVGDVFISNGTEWTIIPSGDEPEGTVISVGMSVPTGLKIKDGTSPVTTSGTIEVQLDEGYVIPKEADIVPSTRKINNITLESDVVLDGDDIKATGYAKAESKSNITGTDTINQALGKLELKSDTNETNISTLAKHINGDLLDSDFQEDSTVAMTKTVPSGMADYAAISKISGKTVKSKNLIPFPYYQVSGSSFGITSVVNKDQSVTLKGTATASTVVYRLVFPSFNEIKLDNKKYIFDQSFEPSVTLRIDNRIYKKDGSYISITATDNRYIEIDNTSGVYDYISHFSVYVVTGNVVNITIKPMLYVYEDEYIPYEPYFEGLRSAPVESVVSTSADGTTKTTLSIPDSDRNLPCFGYGINETVQNIRDYENGTYTQMVAEVDLGDLTWTYNADHTYFESAVPSNLKVPSSNENVANIVCSIYKTIANLQYNNSENKTISISIGGKIGVCDTSYTDAAVFKEAMKGVKLVYELATPVVTDRSDILHPIRVETGGTITLQNEHSLDVPNTVVYKKEVSLNG